jgi:hypothetical protein
MNIARQLFDEYVQDRRGQELALFTREDLGYLVRYTPRAAVDGFVTFARLQPVDAATVIQEQVAYFRSRGGNFEWKFYSFDQPGNLQELLVDRGFVPQDQEAFMVCPVNLTASDDSRSSPCKIVRVDSEQGVRDVVAVNEEVWNRPRDWLEEDLLRRLANEPRQISIYCAYLEGRPVGTGWTAFPQGSKFPELHGGAVLKELRGRGIYKALYLKRLAEVASRNYTRLTVDASPMSRPILEKLGFIHVCNTTPMLYRAS